MPCMLLIENLFKHVHAWVVESMSYTLILVSIGIIVSLQLVSLLTSILYTHICSYICMLKFQIVSISIGIYLKNIYIYLLF